jgi:hypothetical protein
MRELDVAALSSFLDRKVLNVDMPGTFSRPIRVHDVDGSLVILESNVGPDGGKTSSMLGGLGGEHRRYTRS